MHAFCWLRNELGVAPIADNGTRIGCTLFWVWVSIICSYISWLVQLIFYRVTLYASAAYDVVMCQSGCLSAHPSVTSRDCTKMAKRKITQTTTYAICHTPRDSGSLTPKISAKFQRCHPQREREIEVG